MAIELIDKIKQKNNGNFKLVDAIDIELKDGDNLQNFIDNINDVISVPAGECHSVIQNDSEPIEEDVIIWVDTSDSENFYSDTLGDKVINEFRQMFKYLTDEIKELKAKNLDLEARVSYLEQNGTGGGGTTNPDNPDDPSKPDTDINAELMIFEDGSVLIDEQGNMLAFSVTNIDTPDTTVESEIMVFEDGTLLADETGNILVFKSNTVETETNDNILILETQEILITENNEILKLEK